jgi:hypothetical protein
VAVAISGLRAYPNGFEFTVHARVRHEDLPWGMSPHGPVTFVASWLLYGVDETRAEMDSSAVHEAASRAVTLWPGVAG